MGSIKLDGNTLTSTELSLVSMGEKVEVASDAWIRVDAARKVVDNILASGETVYGINTGFGALVSASMVSCSATDQRHASGSIFLLRLDK